MNFSSSKTFRSGIRVAALLLSLPLVLSACGGSGGPVTQDPAKTRGDNSEPAPAPAGTDAPTDTPEVEATEPQNQSGDKTATFNVEGSTYEFTLTTCLVGAEDIVAYGPGRNTQTGEVAFLEVDFYTYEGEMGGGVDVSLGVDTQFTDYEDAYRLDTLANDQGFSINISGKSFTTGGTFIVTKDGITDGGNTVSGSLDVRC